MKLLFDQNISFRIVQLISPVFPDSNHVRGLNLENSSDIEIWNYARNNNLSIVTFDSDFVDLSTLKGSPPKIIWLRFGNTSTSGIAEKIIDNAEKIVDFLENKQSGFLVVN